MIWFYSQQFLYYLSLTHLYEELHHEELHHEELHHEELHQIRVQWKNLLLLLFVLLGVCECYLLITGTAISLWTGANVEMAASTQYYQISYHNTGLRWWFQKGSAA